MGQAKLPGVDCRVEALPPLSTLERQWRDLETHGEASFFTSWDWIGTLLDTMPESARPALLRGVAGGETVALALLGTATERRRGGLIRSRQAMVNATGNPEYDCVTIEHNGLVAAPGFAAAALAGLLNWFRNQATGLDELKFSGVAADLDGALVERIGLRRTALAVPSFHVDLARLTTIGGFEQSLSRNARSQLRRALRRFEADGPIRLAIAGSVAEALTFFEELKQLHCASWERRRKQHSFTRPFFEPFARALISRCHAHGSVQVLRVAAGDVPFGYLLNFRYRDRIYAYQSGFEDSDPKYRPGVAAHYAAIAEGLRSGAKAYDFMAGRNRLKESFATHCAPMLWHVIQQPRLAFHLEAWAASLKHACERHFGSIRNE